jgi:hypothetical protein
MGPLVKQVVLVKLEGQIELDPKRMKMKFQLGRRWAGVGAEDRE